MGGNDGDPCGTADDCQNNRICNTEGLCSDGAFGARCSSDDDCGPFAPTCGPMDRCFDADQDIVVCQ